MPGPEKRFEDRLRKALREAGAWTRKLHGGAFQRDLPDLLVGFAGLLFLVELKATQARRDRMPRVDVLAQLSPGQMMVARELKTLAEVHMFVVAGCAPPREKPWGYVVRTGEGSGYAPRMDLDGIVEALLSRALATP